MLLLCELVARLDPIARGVMLGDRHAAALCRLIARGTARGWRTSSAVATHHVAIVSAAEKQRANWSGLGKCARAARWFIDRRWPVRALSSKSQMYYKKRSFRLCFLDHRDAHQKPN